MSEPGVAFAPAADETAAAKAGWSFRTYRLITLTSLILGYMGYYLCRQNFADAHNSLRDDLHIDDVTFGKIASLGTMVYAGGKFLGGPLTDSFGGRRTFFVGLFGSVLATVAIGTTAGAAIGFLFLFWGVNRAFQSLGWAGLMNIASRWFSRSEYGTAAGWLSISYQIGGFTASLLVAGLVSLNGGWRTLFLGPALILGALGLLLLFPLKASPKDVGYEVPVDTGAAAAGDEPAVTLGERLRMLLLNGPFLIICLMSLVLTLIRESLNTWLPAYLSALGLSTSRAILKSAWYPLLGAAGTIAAGWLSDRFFRKNRAPILVGFLLVAGVIIFGLGHVHDVNEAVKGAGLSEGTVTSVLVGLTGFFVLAPYSMVGGGVFALDHGGRQAPATAVGLLDGFGYIGGTLAGWGVGEILQAYHHDWKPVFNVLTALVFGSALLGVLLTVVTHLGRKEGHA